MPRTPPRPLLAHAAALLLAGCGLLGDPDPRQGCAASAECPAGQYCAPTSGGGVCWADAVAPVVSGVTARCDAPACLRDGLLTVEADVAEAAEVGAVTAALNLDGGVKAATMAATGGGRWRATLDLSAWPLPGLDGTVVATVTAVDGARNQGSATAPAGERPGVTRVRAGVDLAPGAVVVPTAPALLEDGTVLVGGSGGRIHALAPGAADATVLPVSLGAAVTQPPTVGRGALWVVAGNRLFAISLDGASILNGTGYDAAGAVPGPAALTAAGAEVAFIGSAGGRIIAVEPTAASSGLLHFLGAIGPFSTGAALSDDGTLFAVTSTTAPAATLRQFTFADGLREGFTRGVGNSMSAPLAIDTTGDVWTASSELSSSTLQQTLPTGLAGTSIALGASPGGSPVVLAGGDVALSVGQELRRYHADGTPAWAAPAALSGAGLTPLALAGPGAEATLLVPTRAGTVDAVRAADGLVLWSASLTVNVELREGTVRSAAGARTSTAWFTSADGRLHGLVVDGSLDAAAPWPKAWHDARNTGNLATPR